MIASPFAVTGQRAQRHVVTAVGGLTVEIDRTVQISRLGTQLGKISQRCRHPAAHGGLRQCFGSRTITSSFAHPGQYAKRDIVAAVGGLTVQINRTFLVSSMFTYPSKAAQPH
ncbi:hypothetical protein Rhe02_96520 [Rhizocola hellebori]|uniref:Uncharacterized protein n=1 Tax=Rhizocola hellebori TaxID=1392758 RepID=A0A8J3QKV3_9ACTN|nr:hypothetical protein Rhe02_96520 [Rhizocola hellebori]